MIFCQCLHVVWSRLILRRCVLRICTQFSTSRTYFCAVSVVIADVLWLVWKIIEVCFGMLWFRCRNDRRFVSGDWDWAVSDASHFIRWWWSLVQGSLPATKLDCGFVLVVQTTDAHTSSSDSGVEVTGSVRKRIWTESLPCSREVPPCGHIRAHGRGVYERWKVSFCTAFSWRDMSKWWADIKSVPNTRSCMRPDYVKSDPQFWNFFRPKSQISKFHDLLKRKTPLFRNLCNVYRFISSPLRSDVRSISSACTKELVIRLHTKQ